MSAVGSPGARPPRGLSVDHARLKMLARLMALAAVAPQTVAGQELFITTSTWGWADSGGSIQVQLVSSAGAVKASATLGTPSQGALTTWNANGAGFEAGDQIRFLGGRAGMGGTSSACRSSASRCRANLRRSGWIPMDVVAAMFKLLAVARGRFSGPLACATASSNAPGTNAQLEGCGRCVI